MDSLLTKNMNTNQSGQQQPGSWSNASGTNEPGHAAEQSNGAYPDGNGQNIQFMDHPTDYGYASQKEESEKESSNYDLRMESPEFDANFATKAQTCAKTGKPTLENSRDGNSETGDSTLGDPQNSRSRTGAKNENQSDGNDAPQEILQHG